MSGTSPQPAERQHAGLILWVALALSATLVAASQPAYSATLPQPQAVSPGAAEGPAPRLLLACPTFTWSGVAGADEYEIAVVRGEGPEGGRAPLEVRIPAAALSWTPPATDCPAPGSEYAWTVRALTGEGAGEWSEPLFFSMPGTPTREEVLDAIATLERFEAGDSEPSPASAPASPSAAFGGPMAPAATAAWARDSAAPAPQVVSAPGSFALDLEGDLDLGGFVFQSGAPFLHNDGDPADGNLAVGLDALTSANPGIPTGTAGVANTAFGYAALRDTSTGARNVAIGSRALFSNTTGVRNTAVGSRALYSNTSGNDNTAGGQLALEANQTGSGNVAGGVDALATSTAADLNTALGHGALSASTTGSHNTAVGYAALSANSTGSRNVAAGAYSMLINTTGSDNTAIGRQAGSGWTTGTWNIALGSGAVGSAGESGTIRIGGGDLQSATFIEGISGATVPGGVGVYTSNASPNQLGVVLSSRRFKEEIRELDGYHDKLMRLHPVSFRYKRPSQGAEPPHPIEYGLLAEEVAQVFPDLVVPGDDGRPLGVRYRQLTPLLLAEIRRQGEELHRQELIFERQEQSLERVRSLAHEIEALGRQVLGDERDH